MVNNRQGNSSEQKRKEIALRIGKIGYDPDIAKQLTDAGFMELVKRMERVYTLTDEQWNGLGFDLMKYIQMRSPLKYEDLPVDPARADKVKIGNLEKQEKDYALELADFETQLEAIRDASDDQTAQLEQTRIRMQNILRQKQEEVARLRSKQKEG